MPSLSIFNLAFLAFSQIALSSPLVLFRRQVTPPTGNDYVTGYPICNVTGWTEVPGNYTQWTYKAENVTLHECLEACQDDDKCKSMSYAARYHGCWFYDMPVNGTQLIKDAESSFAHYDPDCEFCEDEDDGY